MSDTSKFWIAINAIICVAVVSIVFFSTSYWKDHNTKIVKMIGDGVNPVAVMCAMQNDYGRMPVCIVIAAKNEAAN